MKNNGLKYRNTFKLNTAVTLSICALLIGGRRVKERGAYFKVRRIIQTKFGNFRITVLTTIIRYI